MQDLKELHMLRVRKPKAFRDTVLFVPKPKSWCLDLVILV